jgi:divalent metal cation (Fe/Co/Zn/Cd) transporter
MCYHFGIDREQDDEHVPVPLLGQGTAGGSHDLLRSASGSGQADASESVTTVLVAFGANVLVAVAKSVASVVTGSASILAEAAHSWADTGNEIFLLIANRRSRRPPRDLIEHVLATSDPTLRAVFAEDSAALAGLLIAAAGLTTHQLTGSPIPDAVGSILVGALLAAVSILLINRNRRFLVGQEADPRVRAATNAHGLVVGRAEELLQ